MVSRYARARRGERAYGTARRNYGKNVTLLAGLRLEGIEAPMVIEGAVTTAVFEAYIRDVLVPTLKPGDIVIMDNLIAHKSATVRALLTARGCRLLFLPTYSPDFSPIEEAFSKIKQFLRRVRAQTLDALIDAIAQALDLISPFDAIGYFSDCGFLNLD
jgi:transposase